MSRQMRPGEGGGKRAALAVALAVLSAAWLALVGLLAANVSCSCRLQDALARTHAAGQGIHRAAALFHEGSNILTARARAYAGTWEAADLAAYFRERDVDRRRDRAVAAADRLGGASSSAARSLREAMRESDALMQVELRAMRLAAASAGADPALLPAPLARLRLPPEEEGLEPERQRSLARDLLSDDAYRQQKRRILKSVGAALGRSFRDGGERLSALSQELALREIGSRVLFALSTATLLAIVTLLLVASRSRMSGQERRLLDAIRSERDFVVDVTNAVPCLICVKDAETFRYEWCNDVFFSWLKRRREDIVGKTDFEIFGEKTGQHIRDRDRELLASENGATSFEEPSLFDPGDDRRLRISKKIVLEGGARHIVVAAEDVTEAHRRSVSAAFKSEILEFACGNSGADDVVDFVARRLLDATGCSHVALRGADGSFRGWAREGSADCAACEDCPMRDIPASRFAGGLLKIEDVRAPGSGMPGKGCRAKSILAGRITVAGKPWGALSVAYVNRFRRFGETDELLMQAAAAVVAMSLEKKGNLQLLACRDKEKDDLIESLTWERCAADLWQSFVDSVEIAAYVQDPYAPGNPFIQVNRRFAAVFANGANLVGKTPRDILPPAEADQFDGRIAALVAAGGELNSEVVHDFPDGSRVYLDVHEAFIPLSDGRSVVFGYAKNVTGDYHQTHLAEALNVVLQRSPSATTRVAYINSTLRLLVENLPTWSFVHYLAFDKGRDVWYGASAPGGRMPPFLSEERTRAFKAHILPRFRETGCVVFDDPSAIAPFADWLGGGFPLRTGIALPFYEEGRLLQGVGLAFFSCRIQLRDADLTRHQLLAEAISQVNTHWRTYRELEILNRQNLRIAERARRERDNAIAAERSRSLFFANVSHDIRTPLNSILGFSELLGLEGEDPETRRKYLDGISINGKLLLQLLNDVLDLSKLDAGKMRILPEPCDFKILVSEVFLAFTPGLQGKGIAHSESFRGIPPSLEIDARRVRQMIFNLVGNAVKFTERGSVDFEASFEPDPPPAPDVPASAGTLRFCVSDTGCGIREEDQRRIFKPFEQVGLRADNKGAGMGLAICTALAAKMNGGLSLRSEPGRGSAFTVTLRKVRFGAAAPPDADREPAAAGLGAAAGGANPAEAGVLLVDDVRTNLLVLKAMLQKVGVTDVVLASDGAAAMAELAKRPFGAILTDLWMPNMDGEALVAEVHRTPGLSAIPVYAVTADAEARARCEASGFAGVILKPVTLASLAALFRAPRQSGP